MELNNINNKGAWSEIAAALNQNFLKILAELLKYQHVTTISGANFLGYFTSSSVLPNPAEAAWAVAGDLKAVTVYAYYTSDAVPSGFSAGWNALSSLGTYDFTDYSNLLTKVEETGAKVSELGSDLVGNAFVNPGWISSQNGSYIENSSYLSSNYLIINKNNGISIVGGYSASNAIIAYYDANLNYISCISGTMYSDVIIPSSEIPDNAVYIRMSTQVAKGPSPIVKGFTLTGIMDLISTPISIIDKLDKNIVHLNLSNSTKSILIPYRMGGYIFREDGRIYSSTYSGYSDLIEISNIKELTMYYSLGNTGAAVSFYNEEGEFLKDISVLGGEPATPKKIIKITDEIKALAKYCRLSFYANSEELFRQRGIAYVSRWVINPIQERVDNIESDVDMLKTRGTIHILNPGFITQDGVTLAGIDGFSRHSDKIKIANIREIYSSSVISSNHYSVLFYDESGNFMKDISILGNTTGVISFTEEQLSAYTFIIQYYATDAEQQEKRGVCYITKFIDGFEPLAAEFETLQRKLDIMSKIFYQNNPLKVLIYGDSITDSAIITEEEGLTTSYELIETTQYQDINGNTVKYSKWPFLITQYLNCEDMRVYAKSGASYKDAMRASGNERQNLSYQISLSIADANNPNSVFPTAGTYTPDIIIFALGTNDGEPNDTYENAMAKTVYSNNGTSIDFEGTINNLDMEKFCEAVRKSFMRVRKQWPSSLTFCVLPIQRADIDQYSDGVNTELKKMANRYSILVLDGASIAGIVRDMEVPGNIGEFLKDGLHPNEIGQNLYARMIVNAIKSNYIDMSLMNK